MIDKAYLVAWWNMIPGVRTIPTSLKIVTSPRQLINIPSNDDGLRTRVRRCVPSCG